MNKIDIFKTQKSKFKPGDVVVFKMFTENHNVIGKIQFRTQNESKECYFFSYEFYSINANRLRHATPLEKNCLGNLQVVEKKVM